VAKNKLHNYIKRHRKRLNLTQPELSFLLGGRGHAIISRYERYARDSSLKAALTCEILFGKPVRELFAGLYEQADSDLQQRIRLLIRKLDIAEPKGKQARNRTALLIALLENHLNNSKKQ
jgi:transcriptional regulator with XRE-family HTH domain